MITALIVVSIGVILSAATFRHIALDLRREANLQAVEQGFQYAMGLEALAITILREDRERTGVVDSNLEPWAHGLPPLPVEGGQLTARMTDLDGRFNVNNLFVDGKRQERQIAIMRRLLTRVGADPDLSEAFIDWIDPDLFAGRRGAEDPSYMRFDPPYRAANQAFSHPSEIALVQGMTDDLLEVLKPLITAYPVRLTPGKINVNTARPELLEALDEQISAGAARDLYREGGAEHTSVDRFLEHPRLADLQLDAIRDLIKTDSQYFLAHGVVELGELTQHYYSLIERQSESYRTIARTRGVW